MKQKKHILKLEIKHDYTLIGITSVLEDYHLAFKINKLFNIALRRNKKVLNFAKNKAKFSIYDFENSKTFDFWSLLTNKQIIEEKITKNTFNLFDSLYSTYILIPEKKEVDYFLKIEGEYTSQKIEKIIKNIQTIDGVQVCYRINPLLLKSKTNLIY